MSGLCLVATFDGSEVRGPVLDAMAAAAPHRGVDGTRTWIGPGAGAAHLALEVTGSDRVDRQPRLDGDLVCVADARLDDRGRLEGALRRAGLLTGDEPSDSELLLAAFRRWGDACVDHLLGDFAFAVWDTTRRRLFAARDAMGARPLYYRVEPGRRVLVATELAQLLAAPRVPRVLDEATVLADVAGLYAALDATHYAGTDQLAPAHALVVERGQHRTWRYWTLEVGPRAGRSGAGSAGEQLRAVLTDAVRDRLRSDRPAGMLLSGGLDSTAVAATAAGQLGHGPTAASLRGFSWAFHELAEMDERHVSTPLAEQLGLPVTDVPGDDAWPLRDLPRHGPDQDDPYAWLFQPLFDRTLTAARDLGVRVMLTSDRGDEMTGGWTYDDLGLLLSGRVRMLSQDRAAYTARTGGTGLSFARDRLLAPLSTGIWPPHAAAGLRSRARRFVGTPSKPLAPWVPAGAADRLGLRERIAASVTPPRTRDVGRMHRHLSISDPTSQRIAAHRERTFARHALQYADPWGDRRVAELVCSLPQWEVQRQSEPKRITREAMRGVLPEAARTHPAPSNTYPLFARAFEDRQVQTVRGLLKDSRAEAAGLLDASAVLACYESYLRGGDQSHDFWAPLTVELWLRRWWD